jgi:hypothetical protein
MFKNSFLIVKLDSSEFALRIPSIDGIGEFLLDESEVINSQLLMGHLKLGGKEIPVLNLKKYLNCLNPTFISSPQDRILLYTDKIANLTIGIAFNSINGYNRDLPIDNLNKDDLDMLSELECYQLRTKVIIGEKSIPILEFERIINSLDVKNLLAQM